MRCYLWSTSLELDEPLVFVVDDGRLTEAGIPELGPNIVRMTTPWSDFDGQEHNPPAPVTALLRQDYRADDSAPLVSVAAIGAGGPPVSPQRPTGLSLGTDGSAVAWTWHPR